MTQNNRFVIKTVPRPLMKGSNRKGPRIEPCGTQLKYSQKNLRE